MLYSLRDKYKRFCFARACAGVLQTPPLALDAGSNLLLFCQLQHKDVLLAMIAFKSFAARVPVGHLRVLDDGSLTAEDLQLLRSHLTGVEFLTMEPVHSQACPTGGCWERLLWISRLARDHYVIQLDSDTLTLGELPEVRRCVGENRSFAISTWDHQQIESMAFRQAEAVRYMSVQKGPPHVQLVAEASFDRLDDFQTRRYLRGCAGFSGFAKGGVDLALIEHLSSQMRTAIGDAWNSWGSEQVMSNMVVANDLRAVPLPHPKYCDCTRIERGVTVFVHFIGSCRFTTDMYQRLALNVFLNEYSSRH